MQRGACLIMKNDISVFQQERRENRYTSLRGYFYAVVIIGSLLIIAGVLSTKETFIFSNLLEIHSSNKLALSNSSSNMHDFDTMFALLARVFSIIVLIWVYQAYKNITILAGQKSQWTSWWAVCSYFVPVLNLWRPWQVMQEIIHKSTSEPFSQKKVGIYAAIWWYGLLLTNGYMYWTALEMRKLSTSDHQWSEFINGFRQMGYSTISYLLVIFFILWFTWRITSMQEIKIKTLKKREL